MKHSKNLTHYASRLWLLMKQLGLLMFLKLKYYATGGNFFVDYGNIKLIFSNDGDLQELYYHVHCKEYFENEKRIFQKYLHSGYTAIDVGANLGFVTVILASLVGMCGKVFSFEPSKPVFSKLTKTVADNHLTQVVPYNFACGATGGRAILNKVSSCSGNSSIVSKKVLPGGAEEIEIRPLDSIEDLWKMKVKFLKIDTEGFESDVLLGAKRLIEVHRPVIYIELGGDYLESTHRSLEILKEFGYQTLIPENIDWQNIGNGANFISLPIVPI